MLLPVISRKDVSPGDFIEFWSGCWSAKDKARDEKLYMVQITNPLCPQNLTDLFTWKNQTPLSAQKAKSVKRIIERIPELSKIPQRTSAKSFLNRFESVSAIWRIFLLHCWSKGRYPIYDQHVHRAMAFIDTGGTEEITTWDDNRKVASYLDRYLRFFEPLRNPKSQKPDQALMMFGRFLKTYRL